MRRWQFGQLVAAGFSTLVAAALLVGAGQWQPPSASLTDGKAVPAVGHPPAFQQPAAPGSEQEGPASIERDPKRFYKKPPRARRPRTEMFA